MRLRIYTDIKEQRQPPGADIRPPLGLFDSGRNWFLTNRDTGLAVSRWVWRRPSWRDGARKQYIRTCPFHDHGSAEVKIEMIET